MKFFFLQFYKYIVMVFSNFSQNMLEKCFGLVGATWALFLFKKWSHLNRPTTCVWEKV